MAKYKRCFKRPQAKHKKSKKSQHDKRKRLRSRNPKRKRTIKAKVPLSGVMRAGVSVLQAVLDRSRARMFAALIPSFVIVSSFLADAMAWMNLEEFRWSGLILLLAAVGLLWASRFVRESTLVYAGLWHAVAAVSCLSRSLYAWNGDALLVGWMAVTLALTALALWLASLVARRCRLEDIYRVPCLNTALGLTGVVCVMAVNARVVSREAFGLGASALLLDALVCLLIATSRRYSSSWQWLLGSGPFGGSRCGPLTWRGWPGRRRAWRVGWWSAAAGPGSQPSRA